MPMPAVFKRRLRTALRVALSHDATNGLSAAVGLLLIAGLVHGWAGAFAAAAASVGVIVAIPPDRPAPRHGKFWQLLPAAVIGPPLFLAVQVLQADPLHRAVLLVPASFLAFLGAAWGKRGLPISMSIMFAMIFSMAVPGHGNQATALSTSLYFTFGALAYVAYATLANAALNPRYRVLVLVDALLSVATLMRTQALQFSVADTDVDADANAEVGTSGPARLIGRLLGRQAALADQLQAARDILLEAPDTPRRQQLAGMLMRVLEMRDHLVACALDLDMLRGHPSPSALLDSLRTELVRSADQLDDLADALLLGRRPALFASERPRPVDPVPLDAWAAAAPSPELLARGLLGRVGHIHDEVNRLIALARGDAAPDLALVRATWQLFISPTDWSWRPFAALWRWDAPPLRHAIRAALAIATGQVVAWQLPWGTHAYWILLTIVVVLRGSLAQTLERRNSRVAGTLLGCLLAGALLAAHVSPLTLLVVVTLAQGVSHAFAIRRYLVTAVAATVMALLQAHALNAGASPVFEVTERVIDTLIGAAIAWAFSYVLPSWERSQVPALVARVLAAQARHAREALRLGQLQAADGQVELGWRLARREAYDSLSALVLATQRSLSEPRAVRPPLEPLERLLAHGYLLLAQLTAVKTMLLLRRERLQLEQIGAPLQRAAQVIDATLADRPGAPPPPAPADAPELPALSDPFDQDLSPWLLRRLSLASGAAIELRRDAQQVRHATGATGAAR